MNIVAHNILAMNAMRVNGIVVGDQKKSTEKLSSGYRINRAADDAAGLAISEKMRRQVRGLKQAAANIQDGISYVQVADGALDEIHGMLQRMNELAIHSANGTLTDEDRSYLDSEMQSLKKEASRVFETTSFNERLIWRANDQKVIGTEPGRAVSPATTSSHSLDITNDNYDVIPYNGFKVHADETTGVLVDWLAYNGNTYATEEISWDELEEKGYSVNISDYFGPKDGANADLFDAGGNPVFSHTLSFRPAETASISEIVDSIDGLSMSCYPSVSMSSAFEDSNTGHFSTSASLSYPAAYASKHADSTSGHNFDAADDLFIEPKKTGATNLISHPSNSLDVAGAKASSEGWKFEFEMKGIGTVKAVSNSISFYSNDTDAEDEGRWWDWATNYRGEKYKSTNVYSAAGTLGGLMSTLTGDKGLLSKTAAGGTGMNDSSGNISISFNLKADNAFAYGNTTSQSVGSVTMSFNVGQSDTQQSILDRINRVLNDQTVLDFYASSNRSDGASMYPLSPRDRKIDVPIYGGECSLRIQSGTERDQGIDIIYDSLSLIQLGLKDTNVSDKDAAQSAIDEVKNAMRIVSEQRSVFGAYQNRMEHAYNVNENAAENTQSAESVIRDTDMSKEMVKYSLNNIIAQAGQAMMAQANQSNQGVLQLLG